MYNITRGCLIKVLCNEEIICINRFDGRNCLGCGSSKQGNYFLTDERMKKVLKKAKKEKKLIFIDCYTSWCGPCKMLSSQVFTREDVGNQFNADFVNVKYDMEKDADGVMLKDKFEVKAFPTLVFVDPNTQQVRSEERR